MTRKTYRVRGSDFFYIYITLESGKKKLVRFKGSNKQTKTLGMYITDKKAEQDSLEKHPLFGKAFFLERVTTYQPDPVKTPATVHEELVVPESLPERKEIGSESDSGMDAAFVSTNAPSDGTGDADIVKNVSGAKLYLFNRFAEEKQAIAALKTASEVRSYASGKGVSFPNWK